MYVSYVNLSVWIVHIVSFCWSMYSCGFVHLLCVRYVLIVPILRKVNAVVFSCFLCIAAVGEPFLYYLQAAFTISFHYRLVLLQNSSQWSEVAVAAFLRYLLLIAPYDKQELLWAYCSPGPTKPQRYPLFSMLRYRYLFSRVLWNYRKLFKGDTLF